MVAIAKALACASMLMALPAPPPASIVVKQGSPAFFERLGTNLRAFYLGTTDGGLIYTSDLSRFDWLLHEACHAVQDFNGIDPRDPRSERQCADVHPRFRECRG